MYFKNHQKIDIELLKTCYMDIDHPGIHSKTIRQNKNKQKKKKFKELCIA